MATETNGILGIPTNAFLMECEWSAPIHSRPQGPHVHNPPFRPPRKAWMEKQRELFLRRFYAAGAFTKRLAPPRAGFTRESRRRARTSQSPGIRSMDQRNAGW